MADSVEQKSTKESAPLSQVSFQNRLRWYEAYVIDKRDEISRSKRDRRYYDDIQWTDQEVADFENRCQPVVTFNRIKPKINYILGHEVRTRVDPEAYPRTPEHEDSRGAVTDALRYVDDKVSFDSTRSFCTEDFLIQGCTAVVVGVDDDGIVTKRWRWRNFFYDPKSIDPDFGDAKYLGGALWWDKDDALAEYGTTDENRRRIEEACTLTESVDHPTDKVTIWTDPERARCLIVEMYWREGDQWWMAHTTYAGDLIDPSPVPFVDEDGKSWCPCIATSCYVVQEDDDDGKVTSCLGERRGVVRTMISPQDELNHRRAKALHDSNVYGVIYERGAIDNVRKFLDALATTGGAAEVRDGALIDGRLKLREPGQLADGHLQLMQEAKAEIDSVGPSMPVVAGDKSVLSGRAILAKQSIASMELERPFDNIRQWQRRVFKAWWWLIRDPQYGWKEEMWLRVRDSQAREGYRFVPVNQRMTRAQRVQDLMGKDVPFANALQSVGLGPGEEQVIMAQSQQMAAQQVQVAAQQAGAQIQPQQLQQLVLEQTQKLALQHPMLQEEFVANDLARLCMDIIIEETPDTTIAAQEEAQELMEFAKNNPWIGMPQIPPVAKALLKASIENSNLRNKSALIEALEQKPDPQQAQMQAQAAQAQMQQMQLSLQQMAAQIKNLEAQAQLTTAKIQSERADAQKTQAETQIAIPAEAQKDQATALDKAADAGSKTATPNLI